MVFPMDIASENIASKFSKAFPELSAYYGNYTGFVRVNMRSGFTGKPVTFDMVKGLTLGEGATWTVEFIVTNATNVNQTALTFSSHILVNSPTYLKNFVFFPSVSNVECSNTRLTHNSIGLKLNATELNNKFSGIVNGASEAFNLQFKAGWPLANWNP
jgi:hypothetical protein